MRLLFTALFVLFSFTAEAQNDEERTTPQILSKLSVGNSVMLEDGLTQVTFLKVIEDSRCPTGVTCMWAGQVVFELEITSPNSSEIVTFKIGSHSGVLITTLKELEVFAVSMKPYPKAGDTLDFSTYSLSLLSKKRSEEKTDQ